MPTPDTETLAARLRAVERALTDEDATIDAPSSDCDTDATPDVGPAPSPDGDTETPPESVEHRLCRLEAAVQALHGALDEAGTETTSSAREAPAKAASSAKESVTVAERTGPPRRTAADEHWPDDLAVE